MSGKYALIIGNTEYADLGLARLTTPGRDAEEFARVLADKLLCAFDEVIPKINEPEHVLRRVIGSFFNNKDPDDLLVLYFSGHGVRDEIGKFYLAVKDTVRSELLSTAIPSEFIRDAMDRSRSRRQVLILDCCNSGAVAHGTKAATEISMGTASAFEAGYGRVILTASDVNQYAWEGGEIIGNTDKSLFTHYLVEGLRGPADQDGDGSISVDDLYEYAYEKIKSVTSKQTPSKFSSKQQGSIVLRDNVEVKQPRPAPALPEDRIADLKAQIYKELKADLAAERLAKEKAEKEARLAEEKRQAEEKAKAERKAKREADRIARQEAEAARLAEEKRQADEKAKADQTKKERERIAVQKAKEEQAAKAKREYDERQKQEAARLAIEKVKTGDKVFDEKTGQVIGNISGSKPVNLTSPGSRAGSEPVVGLLKEFSLENFMGFVRAFALASLFIDTVLSSLFGYAMLGSPGKQAPWYLTAPQIILAIVAGFFVGFAQLEGTPATKPFKDKSNDPLWLTIASHAWGLVGFLSWGFLTMIGLAALIAKFVDMESGTATYYVLGTFLAGILIGIERWGVWKDGARDFLAESSGQ
ncbi:MAG: hypothetical protein HND47_10305 [Chloroflexi bacterium]|nr:hypothetical protein [Chloroflexota bacterium]